MKRLLRYVLALSALLLLLPACKEVNDIEEVTLNLSTASVTLPKGESQQTLTIATNQETWSAFSPEESSWLTLSQSGNVLTIQAQANDQGQERRSVILVNAGGLQRKVSVRQAAASLLISVEEEALTLSDVGGKVSIPYTSNTPNPQIELAEALDWVRIERVTPSAITLSTQPNREQGQRIAKINITAGKEIQELEVRQEGRPYYVMPILHYPAPLEVVSEAELARHNALLQLPDGERNKTQYSFKTRSEVMPTIIYEYISNRSFSYLSATSFCQGRENVENNSQFEAFMTNHGFTEQTDLASSDTRVYWNEKLASEATVTLISTGARIVWTYYPKQDKAYPTFTRVPMQEQFEMVGDRDLGIHGKSRDYVRDKEQKEWGSTLKQEGANGSYDIFELTKPFDGELFRSYYYVVPDGVWIEPGDDFEDEVSGGQAYFENVHLVFFQDQYGHFFPTQEVKRFFAKHGYPFIKKLPTDGAYVYYDTKTKRAYVCNITVATIDGKQTLLLYVQIYLADLSINPTSSPAALSSASSQVRLEKKLSDRLVRLTQHSAPRR